VIWAFQSEYRLPLWWRFGMVGFVGIGNVHPSLDDMSFSKSKYSAGFGIRYFLVPKEGINIRLDIAFGEESSSVYLYFLEAF
jgi:outer membrane translocation and assembly module TamA